MKTTFLLLLMLGTTSVPDASRPAAPAFPAASASTSELNQSLVVAAEEPGSRLLHSGPAGYVAQVYLGTSGRVRRGQVLARLQVPFVSAAQRRAQQLLHHAEAAYAANPTPENEARIADAKVTLAALPRWVQPAYLVAPADGELLVSERLVAGQYLPRATVVAVLRPVAEPVPMVAGRPGQPASLPFASW